MLNRSIRHRRTRHIGYYALNLNSQLNFLRVFVYCFVQPLSVIAQLTTRGAFDVVLINFYCVCLYIIIIL